MLVLQQWTARKRSRSLLSNSSEYANQTNNRIPSFISPYLSQSDSAILNSLCTVSPSYRLLYSNFVLFGVGGWGGGVTFLITMQISPVYWGGFPTDTVRMKTGILEKWKTLLFCIRMIEENGARRNNRVNSHENDDIRMQLFLPSSFLFGKVKVCVYYAEWSPFSSCVTQKNNNRPSSPCNHMQKPNPRVPLSYVFQCHML